jgi:endoglucanase
MKKTILLTLLVLSGYSVSAQNSSSYFGVNLACAEFGSTFPGTYNSDYTYPSTSELDYFSAKGLKLIRLPIKWERIQPTLGGALDVNELNRIHLFINNANTRNMVVIIDLHNYCRRSIGGTEYLIGSTNVSINNITDMWFRLADALKAHTNIWGYGLMNEPHDLLTSATWLTISQKLIDAIRTTDLTTSIIVGGDSWSSAARWMQFSDNLKNLKDPSNKLIFEAHVYFDADASGQYLKTYDLEGATPNTGITRVTPFVNWLQTNKLKGFIGEYGVPKSDSRWLTVLDNFLSYLKSNCINGTYWAAGPWWGNYALSIEPKASVDAPQMAIVKKYLTIDGPNCVSAGIDDVKASSGLQIFPNPTNDFITIKRETANTNGTFVILNEIGQQVFSGDLYGETTRVDIRQLMAGSYILNVLGNDKQSIKLIRL